MNRNIRHVLINRHEKCYVVAHDKINYLKASGTYTHFELTDGLSILSSKPLNYYERILNPDFFVRPHRTYILNFSNIKEIIKGNGDGIVLFENRQQLYISREFKNNLIHLLESTLNSVHHHLFE